ncbi:MAG: hypothetical protein ACYCZ0_03750 [Minisyncoccota bacterium]
MKIIICSSISAADEVLAAKKELESMGHEVEIPEGVKNPELRARTEVANEEKADDKIKHDLIRGYFEKIKEYDVLLVVNPEKRGVLGYIGGNTLIEMAFGHVLKKPLYVMHGLPELSYKSEILAMQPRVINGDLSKIK